jgi:hypothetical protein
MHLRYWTAQTLLLIWETKVDLRVVSKINRLATYSVLTYSKGRINVSRGPFRFVDLIKRRDIG